MDINVAFCRELLRRLEPEVKAINPTISVWRRPSWVYQYDRSQDWEFHFGDFYWYGRADNAFDARWQGWSAWLEERRKLRLVPGGRAAE